MGAFFKTSCAVFWIIWMSASASLFGFEHMQQMYTYEGREDNVSILIAAACGLTILMSIVGCCCVKTDASNMCCAFFYLVGFSLPIFLLCVALLIYTQNIPSYQHEIDILRRTKRLYDAGGTIPRFLHNTQVQYKCCGVYGFKDFRAFILLNDDKMKEDVPFSCCKNQSGFNVGKCHPVEAGPNPIENIFNRTGLKIPFPLPKTGKNFTRRYELYGSTGRCGGKACLAQDLLLYGDPGKVASIHTEGCYERLKKNTENLHSSFSQFSIFLMACVLLMAVLFTQNCLKARKKIKNPEDVVEQERMETLSGPLSEKYTEEMLISELAQTEARRDSLMHSAGPKTFQPNILRASTDTTASANIRRF